MTLPLISLASGVLPEFTPQQTARAAAKAGFKAVGLWVEPDHWTAATSAEVRAILGGEGLAALDVEVVWIRPGPLDPAHLRIIDVAHEIGAAHVLVVSSDPDRAATAAKLGALVDHGRSVGVRVCLEFGAFTDVRDLAAALDVIDRTGREDTGLLIDPLHLARTGGHPRDLAGIPALRLPYAQFCDAPAVGADVNDVQAIIEEAVDRRLLPGEGDLPLAELVRVLPAATPLSVELRSKPLREAWPDPAMRAAVVLRASQKMLTSTKT